MRLMERIRRNGQMGLMIFIGIFVISIFAGLGVSNFYFGRNQQQQDERSATKPIKLSDEGQYKDAAVVVNGRPVTNELFYATLENAAARATQDANDPGFQFEAYGQVAMYLIRQEMVMSKAQDLGIKVTNDDLTEERTKVTAQYMATDQGQSGNVVGDLTKKLSSRRDQKEAFTEFLMRNGTTEEQWLAETKRSVMSRKTLEAIQGQLDAEKKIEATAIKAKVDEALAKGTSFADVVKEYSEGPAAETGGDIGTWIQRGLLFSEEAENVLFKTPKGEISDWIEIPAGFQRFEVYDKVTAEGPEFETAKAGIIEGLKTEKGADYVPTDDEVAKKFEKVKARQLVIKTTETGAAEKQVADEMKQAKVEINNPFILAYQAIYGDRLQPPASFELEQLSKIAQNSAVGEGYDYGLIAAKLKKGLPEMPKTETEAAQPGADATAAPVGAEATAEPTVAATDAAAAPSEAVPTAAKPTTTETATASTGDQAAGEATPPATEAAPTTAGDTPAAAAPATPVDETLRPDGSPVPIYALGIGLFKLGLQEQGDSAGYFPYYMLAKIYMDWLKDEDAYAKQPVDRAKARQEVEDNLARVVERYEYSPLVHAYRGLNLAWLDKPEEARKSLELAQKYVPRDDTSEAFALIKEAYEVLNDTEKVAEIDKLITALRQERMQKQIEEAQARQQAQQQGQTPFSPGAGQPPAPSAPPQAPPTQGGAPSAPPAAPPTGQPSAPAPK